MTGGRVVVLGKTGRNFAAGMSGGIAYVLDFEEARCNRAMVLLEAFASDKEKRQVRELIERHVEYTASPLGKRVLDDWEAYAKRFTRVIPRDYKQMLQFIDEAIDQGLQGDEALMAAFERGAKE